MTALCQQRHPSTPHHPAIVGYLDFRRFGILPRVGGTFDQPGDLMDDLRYVHDRVAEAERVRAEEEARRARSSSSSAGGR